MLPGQMLLWRMLPRQFASVKDGSRNPPSKFGQNRVSKSWDIPNMDKCCQDKCCLDKCHLFQLESVHCDPRNLPLKFGQNRIANCWDFGGGSCSCSCPCSCCSCCTCDGGKTKSTPCPTWTELCVKFKVCRTLLSGRFWWGFLFFFFFFFLWQGENKVNSLFDFFA